METILQIKLLAALKRTGKPFDLTVTGISMNPVLYESDIVTISPEAAYNIGDILVFVYNQNEMLLHRLIEIKDEIYYFKGDNALRMEKALFDQISGKVTGIIRNEQSIPIPPCTDKLITMAKAVNTMFFKRRYDVEKTKETYIYKMYKKIFIDGEDIKMYIKNEKMDYIETDETSVAIFNPENSDTHFLDEAGVDIMKILEQPHDFDALITKICEIYDGGREEITGDIREFLNNAMEKGIVVEL